MKKLIYLLVLSYCNSINALETDTSIYELSIDELFNMKVQSASGIDESYLKAPASMVVITAQEIEDRGYLSLDEVMMDLPGFDISIGNGTSYMQAYQRGYRTPFTQRTLLMINGKVDNHLWTHMANISRQYPIGNIARIEILYGPASAVYGPNAFLGIINIITKNGKELADGESIFESSIQFGSNNTRSVDLFSAGKNGGISYAIGAKIFRSDEEDLSNKYGFNTNELYGDTNRWGPLLDQNHRGVALGKYADPTDDWGVNGEINMGDLTLGFNSWVRKEAYGAYYAADRAQNNTMWNYNSNQIFLDYNKKVSDKLQVNSTLLYRTNRVWGAWVEATAMWDSLINSNGGSNLYLSDRGLNNADFSDYAFISYTNWNSINNSWLFKQNFNYQHNDKLSIQGGIKYNRKELTKAYDIPGYWGVFSSVAYSSEDGPHGYGTGIGNSTDATYEYADLPASEMPDRNLIFTTDVGGFVQSIVDFNRLRFVGGVRFDQNSLYGESINPRVSAIYVFPEDAAVVKLIYGEAFQEPAPLQLFGGWNGRSANPDLKPEKAKNLEFVTMVKQGKLIHQLSIYRGKYENVIKESAENAGTRKTFGIEYSIKAQLFNPFSSRDISLYSFYTYSQSTSNVYYDFDTGSWEDGEAELGDISPHKINLGVNFPIKDRLNLNLRSQYVHDKTLYLRNPLRNQGEVAKGYFNLNGNLSFKVKECTLGLNVKNILDAEYFHSGVESASAGNNFTSGSTGFHNSLLPQASRSFMFYFKLNY